LPVDNNDFAQQSSPESEFEQTKLNNKDQSDHFDDFAQEKSGLVYILGIAERLRATISDEQENGEATHRSSLRGKFIA
jgi:hypothetical protein